MSTTSEKVLAPTILDLGDSPLSKRRRGFTRTTGTRALGLVLFLVVWELAALVVNDRVVLPSVQTTASTFVRYMGQPYPSEGVPLWADALISLARILAGFIIGCAGGLAVGAVMASSRVLRNLIDPVIEVTRPLPPLAFIPLFIVWFGIGETSKVLLIVFGVVPIMAIATVGALEAVPDEFIQAGKVLGAGQWYNLLHVRVRGALPAIVMGMRIAMGISWTSIVAVEMIAATSGVGYVILQAGSYLVTSLVFSGIIMIAIMGLILDGLLRAGLRKLQPAGS